METCSQSGDRELSEDLLVYFIEQVCFKLVLLTRDMIPVISFNLHQEA
jgi:hypothetical protein